MFDNFNPEIRKVLVKKEVLINGFSIQSKINILRTTEIGNVNASKQQIEYTGLGGDY
jgi:hypothetical protein